MLLTFAEGGTVRLSFSESNNWRDFIDGLDVIAGIVFETEREEDRLFWESIYHFLSRAVVNGESESCFTFEPRSIRYALIFLQHLAHVWDNSGRGGEFVRKKFHDIVMLNAHRLIDCANAACREHSSRS